MFHIETFASLAAHLTTLPRKRSTLLIGTDAPGGAGKSTFMQSLRRALPDSTGVQMDDFFLPSHVRLCVAPGDKPLSGDFDCRRVSRQVLEPLSRDQPAVYQRFDWNTDRLAEWHAISPGGIVVVEGCYALYDALAPYYDFTIWLECPRETRLARGIARSGEQIREIWERDWMVAEDRYIAAQHPQDRAALVVDSSGMLPHDPMRTYVHFSGIIT